MSKATTSTKRRLESVMALLLLLLLLTAGLLTGGTHPAHAAGSPTIFAPWDAGKTFTVGNPPNSPAGGGYYGHCCGQNPDLDYFAVDINGPGNDCGENVRATNDGTVIKIGTYSGSQISYLRIDHGGGYTSEYQHITNPVPEGTAVSRGDVIAKFGSVGATSCHLHFVVKLNGTSIAPSPMSGTTLPASSGVVITSDNSPGTPTGPDDPKGNFEGLTQVLGGVHLVGWALDPNTPNPVEVDVYEGTVANSSTLRAITTASAPRPDVGAAYPGLGDNHGFAVNVGVANGTAGSKTYCAYAINTGAGSVNPLLGCRTVTFNWNPYGNYEALLPAPGGVYLNGWSIDPDSTNPVEVDVYEGTTANASTLRAIASANGARPDVGAANPGYGDNHGFATTVGVGPAVAGVTKTYCAYAVNTGSGNASPQLGCRTITLSDTPTGNFESATAIPGGIRVRGWAIDPNTGNPIAVHFYANATGFARTADKPRPDVGGAWPAYGANHGFDEDLTLAPGTYNVCAYAINAGAGNLNPQLACKSVTVS